MLWYHALRLEMEEAHLAQKTLHNFRVRLMEHDGGRLAFCETTDRMIEALGLRTGKQRLDSTHVMSNIAVLTRLGLFCETVRVFLLAVSREHPGLGEGIGDGLAQLAYLPELGTLDRRQVAALVGVRLPSTGTAGLCGANAPSGADGPACGPPSTWGRCPRPAATPSYETSIRDCWPLVSRRRWPLSRVCANCSSPSTPCLSIAPPGAA